MTKKDYINMILIKALGDINKSRVLYLFISKLDITQGPLIKLVDMSKMILLLTTMCVVIKLIG